MKIVKSSHKCKSLSRRLLLLLIYLALFQTSIYSQCDMFCEGRVNVGFDTDTELCIEEIEANTVLKNYGSQCLSGDFSVYILDETGTQMLDPNGMVDYEWVGRSLQYKVLDNVEGGNCWGYLDIEDKRKPELLCNLDPINVYCYDSIDKYIEENFQPVDCDDEVKLEMVSSLRNVNRCEEDLPENVLVEIKVTLVGVDSWGNVSDDCVVTFNVMRIPSLNDDFVDYPESFSKDEHLALSCDYNLPADERGLGFPSPIYKNGMEGTGVPSIEGIPLYPNNGLFCNLWVDYVDEKTKEGCKTRIIRNWIITETSCTDDGSIRIGEKAQIIDIVDDKGPEIEALPDMMLTTDGSVCGRTLRLDPPLVSDTCDHGYTLDLKIEGHSPGFIPNFKKGDEVELDTGLNVLIFTATDECNNSNKDTILVRVQDLTPPTTICKTYTVASLVEEGVSMVHASSFDNGSKDDCYLKKILVKRMDDGAPCGNEEEDTYFDEYVGFCCADLGHSVIVLVRSYDSAGNMSECMVEVEVQDKIRPLISCPPDLTLSCGIDLDDLSAFGTVRKTPGEVETFEVNPDYFINKSGPLVDGLAFDNCSFSIKDTAIYNLDNCGAGTIERRFIITGNDGSQEYCVQTLTIEKNPLFFENMEVYWPHDTTLYDCLEPDDAELKANNLGSPQFLYQGCQMVGVTSVDEVYNFSNNGNGACFKILRNWTIIDWCAQEDRGNNYLKKTDTQVIKVVDTIPPMIIGDYPPIDTCSYDDNCLQGIINLKASAENTNCGADVKGYFEIDKDGDGSYNYKSGIFSDGEIDTELIYDIGNHIVKYVFYDQCGNTASREQEFNINNCKGPTPYALNGLAIDLMRIDTSGEGRFDEGMAEIWASDFDAGSSHPCDLPVILSFSSDTTDKSRTFFCDERGLQTLEIWATIVSNNGELIQSFTTSTIDIQDNQTICSNTFTADIVGNISSHAEMPVNNATVHLEGGGMAYATDETGSYAFPSMNPGGGYKVIPEKNDEVLNGVNTLDLVKIQRHILGVKPFEAAYQYIAADINKDGALSASDIIELRKLILGLNDSFDSNNSWRFIDKSYVIPNASSVLEDGFPESYKINDFQSNMSIDFMGIKIGDVDGDHRLTNSRTIATRENNSIDFSYPYKEFRAGETVRIQLTTSDRISIIGLQLSIQFTENIDLLSVESEEFKLNNDEYYFDTQSNILTISKAIPEALSLSDEPVLSFEFIPSSSGSTADLMTLTRGHILSQVYDKQDNIYDVLLHDRAASGEYQYQLYQNSPNPFYEFTDIVFELPTDQEVNFTVYDVTGKLVFRKNRIFMSGKNSIRINSSEFNAKGMLYYQIKANDFIASRKMVAIR